MKKLEDLKRRKSELLRIKGLSQKEKRELEIVNNGILYLEFNPTEDYLRKAISEINDIISSKKEQFDVYRINSSQTSSIKKTKSQFNGEMEFTKMRAKLKLIKYILND